MIKKEGREEKGGGGGGEREETWIMIDGNFQHLPSSPFEVFPSTLILCCILEVSNSSHKS